MVCLWSSKGREFLVQKPTYLSLYLLTYLFTELSPS
jgi:hypothetical protein